MYPPLDPIVFEFGPIALRWYGLLMVSAIFIGSSLASQYIGRKGGDPDDFWDMLVWVLVPALFGARLYYVFIQSPRGPSGLGYYLSHPASIFRIWEGGIHIFGAFIFGGIAVWLYTKLRQLPLLTYLDAIGLALPISQAIGRWGNFINQELYGPPTDLPWGLYIDPAHRIPPFNDLVAFPESTRFQPLFLYESLWNFLGFAIIFWISRRFQRELQPGDLMLCYLLWYPLGRFGLEFLRTDSWFFPGTPFNVVHILSSVAIVGAAIVLYSRHGFKLRQNR
ncbi:MAG: prolipoprotein diacylglyceryl transferase [Prochlorothrix sp.]|nr:prolipoprotein diacylglyceryl transferase [Prochlorothrix sp.]